jgi:hypothetical protein
MRMGYAEALHFRANILADTLHEWTIGDMCYCGRCTDARYRGHTCERHKSRETAEKRSEK